jgi:thiamine transporter
MKKHTQSIRALTEGAIFIALAEILSFLPLYKLPWGGSIDLAMLPILIFCCRWGFGPGMLASFAHALLQTLFEGGIAIGWQSILGDFLLAYAVLGFAGLFRGRFCIGASVACTLRFLTHYVVGATIWAEYMPESFFGMTMTSPWLYSALYNGAYMLPDLILVLAAWLLLQKTPLAPYLTESKRD